MFEFIKGNMEKYTEKKIHLILTPEESHWLKCIMQNPLFVAHPSDENKDDKCMRKMFFEATEYIK